MTKRGILDRLEQEAVDVNFSIHFPWIDKLFGTLYLPEGRWPTNYGMKNGCFC